MIPKQNLEEIAKNKLSCSILLFKSKMFDTSLYLVGYSVEMALKYKICKIFNLKDGFPETKKEFDIYISDSDNNLGEVIKNLRDIRNHDLEKLLFYSGQEFPIKLKLLDEWTDILYWNPELRYKLNIGDKNFNETIIKSVEKILTLIFK